jgi:hypothetical protein
MSLSPIAVHEAAHAAVYCLAGRERARIVELQFHGDSGLCRVRTRSGMKFPHAIIAGYVGELRALHGKDWRPTPEDFAASLHLTDIADAAALVGVEGLPRLWDSTASMIGGCAWSRIEGIAAALQEAGTLSGEDVELIWRRPGVLPPVSNMP